MLAARAFRQALGRGTSALSAADRALAHAGLARAYEQQQRWEAARAAWQRLAAEAGDQTIAALDPARSVRDFVARQLGRRGHRTALDQPRLNLALPLLRRWPAAETEGEERRAESGKRRAEGGGRSAEGKMENTLPRRIAERLLVPDGCSYPERCLTFLPSDTDNAPTLTCRDAANGKTLWHTPGPERPFWTGHHGGSILVAGGRTVQCLSQADGKRLWEFAVPPSFRSSGDSDLCGFHLTRTTLFCLVGDRRLIALDADTGQVLWSRWAPGAQVRPLLPAGRFNPLYHAGEKWIVVQTGSGKLLVLNARSGRLVHEVASPSPWTQAPLPLAEDLLCLARDSRQVVLFDPAAGKDLWVYQTARRADTSLLTGELPRILGNGRALLVVVPRNYGYQLERLDPDTGVPLWPARARVVRDPIEPDRACLDRAAVYYASRHFLCARSLKDGKLLWARPLPGRTGNWRVACCGKWVLVHPVHPKQAGQDDDTWSQATAELIWPVFFCDPKDGAVVQRLNFAEPALETAVQLVRHGLVVAAAGRVWGFAGAAEKQSR
jgi:outer membrane protein assembly factor BamB